MKKPKLILTLLITINLSLFTIPTFAQITQSSQWTWVNGDTTINNFGIYGTKGVAATGNKPGVREGCGITWTDASGNLWLFGDYGFSAGSQGLLNDLWKYDPVSFMWTWVNGDNTINNPPVFGTKGVAASTNNPGGRHLSTTWIDNSGNFWLFGGQSNLGDMNDLWKYDVAANQWTWMSGDNTGNTYGMYGTRGVAASANKPGARNRACRFDGRSDASGNLWLLGGSGNSSGSYGDLNDLWKYNITTNQWTWMAGDNAVNGAGVYGTMGVPAATNKPGARVGAVCWIDAANKLWLSGGSGTNSNWSPKFSDLWKYDPSTSEWTWMKGDNTTDNYGVYGTQGVAASANNPGGRLMSLCWIDNTGNFWVFGGYGFSSVGTGNATGTQGLNDLWKYDPNTNNWTWVKGDNSPNVAPVYGTPGIASATNKPGNRSGGDQWKDGLGNIWQFGGIDWAVGGFKNDFWKLDGFSILPISITSINAYEKNNGVRVEWKLAQETNMDRYEVEKSATGINFSKSGTVPSSGDHSTTISYNWLDTNPNNGVNFYRIKMIDKNGKDSYSHAVKVIFDKGTPSIIIYPNPVTTHSFALQFNDLARGNYNVKIMNIAGEVVYKTIINHDGWSRTQTIHLPLSFPQGVYNLEIITPDNKINAQQLIIPVRN